LSLHFLQLNISEVALFRLKVPRFLNLVLRLVECIEEAVGAESGADNFTVSD